MQHVNVKVLREKRRISRSLCRVGYVVGKGSEWFFGGVLSDLCLQGKIQSFTEMEESFPEFDFKVQGFDGEIHKINVKSSKRWLLAKKKPGIIYIVVGLHPDIKKILKELRKCGVIK